MSNSTLHDKITCFQRRLQRCRRISVSLMVLCLPCLLLGVLVNPLLIAASLFFGCCATVTGHISAATRCARCGALFFVRSWWSMAARSTIRIGQTDVTQDIHDIETLRCCGCELRVHRKYPSNCCCECGYNLRGLTEPRCPECGTPFDEKLLRKNEP